MQKIMTTVQRWKKQLTTKKLITILVIVLLCSLPIIFASLYVHYYDYIYHANHISVELYDENGNQLVTEEGSPETATPGSMVDLFYQLTTKKTPLLKPMGDPNTDDFVLAKINLNGTPTELKCYFSKAESQGYCIDQTGKIYSIPDSVNTLFLVSPHGELFYSNADIPTLTTIDGDQIIPSSATWYYQAIDGEFLQAKDYSLTQEQILYEITGTISIQFNDAPDTCSISIFDSKGTPIKENCSLDDLSSISVNTGTRLTMRINAEWSNSKDRSYYGSVNYNFDIQLQNPSTFTVHKTSVKAGEFLLISCTNINIPDRVKILVNQKELSLNFLWDGSMARGILPIPESTTLKEMNLQVSYGASKQDFSITIQKEPPLSLSKPDWNEVPPLNASQALTSLLSSLPSAQGNHFYFRGNFLDPTASGFSTEYAHGSTILCGTEQKSFLSYGTEFVTDLPGEVGVAALNHGTVIRTGENTSLGKFVIVEHGGGLRTVYGALNSITVEIGESIQKGDIIGKTSTLTRSGKNGFLLLCTINETLINPAYIIGKKLSFPA